MGNVDSEYTKDEMKRKLNLEPAYYSLEDRAKKLGMRLIIGRDYIIRIIPESIYSSVIDGIDDRLNVVGSKSVIGFEIPIPTRPEDILLVINKVTEDLKKIALDRGYSQFE